MFLAFGAESGNHTNGPTPFMAVAGYLAEAATWRVFKSHWSETLEEFGLPAFHLYEYLSRKNLPYSEWSDRRYQECIEALIGVITTYNVHGFAVQVSRQGYDACISLHVKKKLIHGPYILLFDTAITLILRRMFFIPHETVTLYFHRTSFEPKARKDYERRKKNDPNGHRLAEDIFFVSEEFSPIQAADLLAGLARNYARGKVTQGGLPITPQIEACLRHLNSRVKTQWRLITKEDLQRADESLAKWLPGNKD